MTHFTVTANRLLDGGVVYLTVDRRWAPMLDEAAIWAERTAADAEHGWARGQERVICDPYVLDVGLRDGQPVPLSARERIRAEGPLPTLRRLGYLEAPTAQRAAG